MSKDHKYIISGIAQQLKNVLNSSEQAIYIYLDDLNKVCNERFSSMLDYSSPHEWAKVSESFPMAFVEEKSRNALVNAYQNAMEKGVASSIRVTWKKKSGGNVNTNVILVPIEYEDHVLAIHFISKEK